MDEPYRVSELLYASFDRALHPEFLGASDSFVLEGGGITTSVYLGRAGHLAVFRTDGASLSEMVVPRDHHLPRSGLIKACSFGDLMKFSFKHGGPLSYKVSLRVERLEPDLFEKRVEDLICSAKNVRAACRRDPEDDLSFSIASVREESGAVLMSVLHFCKADHSIVRSSSIARVAT